MSKIEKYYPEIVGSVVCLTLGMLSGYVSHASDSLWYAELSKPFFNPPAWIFAPVWAVLYLMIGIVFGMLWKDRVKNQKLILLFIAQLIFNLAWSPLFFYYHRIGWALLDLWALWDLLGIFMAGIVARNQRSILFLIVPYFLWVGFAFALNMSIYFMNR